MEDESKNKAEQLILDPNQLAAQDLLKKSSDNSVKSTKVSSSDATFVETFMTNYQKFFSDDVDYFILTNSKKTKKDVVDVTVKRERLTYKEKNNTIEFDFKTKQLKRNSQPIPMHHLEKLITKFQALTKKTETNNAELYVVNKKGVG